MPAVLFLLSLCCLLGQNALAEPPLPPPPPPPANAGSSPPPPPQIEGTSYLLQDFHSGQVLLEKEADKPVEPASLTKLMSAYVVFNELRVGHIKLTDKVRISENAWRTGGSRMYLKLNSEVSIDELLKGMIIQSGNDASVALAEHIAGSEDSFAGMMNHYVQHLGLTGSHFLNCTGMPAPGHVTTARDMASVANAIIRDFPEHYPLYSQKEYSYNGITQHNRNLLLWRDPSVDGMKTGHTESAGYCLVTSALRDNMRLISVVMGTASTQARASESQKMLNYGFRFFETHKLYDGGKALDEPTVWKGEVGKVGLGLEEALYVTLPLGQYSQLRPTLQVLPQIIAPVQAGDTYGTLRLSLQDQVLTERPLVALKDVQAGNLFQRTFDYLLMLFE